MEKPRVLLLYRKSACKEIVQLISDCVPDNEFELVSWQRLNEKTDVWMTKLQGYIENPLCYRVIVLMHNTEGQTNPNVAFELGYASGFQKGKLALNSSLGEPVGTTTAVACSSVFEAADYPADLRQLAHTTYEDDILSNPQSEADFKAKLRNFLDLSRTEVLTILPSQVKARADKCNVILDDEAIAICQWVTAFSKSLRPEVASEDASAIVKSVLAFYDNVFDHLVGMKRSLVGDKFNVHKRFVVQLCKSFYSSEAILNYRDVNPIVSHLEFLRVCTKLSENVIRATCVENNDIAQGFDSLTLHSTRIIPFEARLQTVLNLIERQVLKLLSLSMPTEATSDNPICTAATEILNTAKTKLKSAETLDEKIATLETTGKRLSKFVNQVHCHREAINAAQCDVNDVSFNTAIENAFASRCRKIGGNFDTESDRLQILIDSAPSLKRMYAPDVFLPLLEDEKKLIGNIAGKGLTESPTAVKKLVEKVIVYSTGVRSISSQTFVEPRLSSLLESNWRKTLRILLSPSTTSVQVNRLNQHFVDLSEMLVDVPTSGDLVTSVGRHLNLLSRSLQSAVSFSECETVLRSATAGCRAELRRQSFDRSFPTMFAYFAGSAVLGMAIWFVLSWIGGHVLANALTTHSETGDGHNSVECSLWRYLLNPNDRNSWNNVLLVGLGLGIASTTSAAIRYLFVIRKNSTLHFLAIVFAVVFCALLGWIPSNITRSPDKVFTVDTIRALATFVIFCGMTAWLPDLRKKAPSLSVVFVLGATIWVASFGLKLVSKWEEMNSVLAQEIAIGSGMIAAAFLLTRIALVATLKFRGAYSPTVADAAR